MRTYQKAPLNTEVNHFQHKKRKKLDYSGRLIKYVRRKLKYMQKAKELIFQNMMLLKKIAEN